MTDPQGNAPQPQVGTPLLDGCQWKNSFDWFSALPPLLNGRGAEDKVANRVLSNLASRADHKTGRNAYPSNAWLAERCHVSERSVRSALARLEEAKRIERDGLSRHGTIKWRLRFEYDVPAGWLPIDAREQHKRELAAERQRRRRAKLISEVKCVTEAADQAIDSEAECVTGELISEAECVTQADVTQLASDNQSFSPPAKETSQRTSAVAAAPTVGEIIDAELIDDDGLPGIEGVPLLAIEPPSAELAPASDALLSTPAAARALGIGVEKLRRLLAEQQVTPAQMNGKRPLWSLPALRAEFAAAQAAVVPALVNELLPNLTQQWVSSWNSPTPPQSAAYFDPTLWPMPASKRPVTEWQQALVDAWYQRMLRDCRRAPSKTECGRAVREIHALLHAGNNPNHIVAACWLAAGDPRLSIARAMDRVNPSVFATSSAPTARRTGTVLRNNHGVFEVPDGLSKGDENDVNRMMLRTQLRSEHFDQLDRLGVRKIA